MLYAQVLVATTGAAGDLVGVADPVPRRICLCLRRVEPGSALALVYGGTDPAISMSMHYNRWAWAAAFVAVALAVLPRTRRSARRCSTG
ncbi:MAG: hypothetical protein R3D80_14050 [Paracoccaceae bacterium]